MLSRLHELEARYDKIENSTHHHLVHHNGFNIGSFSLNLIVIRPCFYLGLILLDLVLKLIMGLVVGIWAKENAYKLVRRLTHALRPSYHLQNGLF